MVQFLLLPLPALRAGGSQGLIQLCGEADQAPPSSANVKNAGSHNYTFPYAFVACTGRHDLTPVTFS